MRSFVVMFLIGTVLGAALMFVLVETGKLGPTPDADDEELNFDATVQAEPGSPQQQRIDFAKKLESALRKDNAKNRVRADGLVLRVKAPACNQAFVVKLAGDKREMVDLGFARLTCSHGRAKAWIDL